MDKKNDFDESFYERLTTFLEHLNKETERGKALIVASLLDEMLAEILVAYLLDEKKTIKELIFSNNAPLGSLHSRNLMVYSLGFITEQEFRDINKIRKIRNEFAHLLSCSFEHQKVKDLALELKCGMQHIDELPEGHKSKVNDASQRFTMVSTSLVSDLYNRAYYVKRYRLPFLMMPHKAN